jgi:hypothetical protein
MQVYFFLFLYYLDERPDGMLQIFFKRWKTDVTIFPKTKILKEAPQLIKPNDVKTII